MQQTLTLGFSGICLIRAKPEHWVELLAFVTRGKFINTRRIAKKTYVNLIAVQLRIASLLPSPQD